MSDELHAAVLHVRDIVHVMLMAREGRIITEDVARERANNIATALMPLLAPRGHVVRGEIEKEKS